MKTHAKRARPIAVHKVADGTKNDGTKNVGTKNVGLMRVKDGRWRASGPE